MIFAPLIAIAAMTIGIFFNLSWKRQIRSKRDQQQGVMYSAPQNIFESNPVISAMSSSDSNIHSFDPSSRTYDHHLSPTSNRPEMFFTVQKSNARRTIHSTNESMKFDVNHDPKTYTNNAKLLNNKWKNIASGCYMITAVGGFN